MKTGQQLIPYELCQAIIPLPDFVSTVQYDDSQIHEGSEAILGFSGMHIRQKITGRVYGVGRGEIAVCFDEIGEVSIEQAGIEYAEHRELLGHVKKAHARMLSEQVELGLLHN